MSRRKPRSSPAAAALAFGVGVNAIAVSFLLIGHGRPAEPTEERYRTMIVLLDRPALPARAPARPVRHSEEPERLARSATAAGSRQAAQPNDKAAMEAGLASSPPPVAELRVDDGGLEAARAVLRHLQECGRLASGRDHAGADCGAAREVASQSVDGVSTERRIDFDADRRRMDDALSTNARLQSQTLETRGDAARFGCTFTAQERRCGSY